MSAREDKNFITLTSKEKKMSRTLIIFDAVFTAIVILFCGSIISPSHADGPVRFNEPESLSRAAVPAQTLVPVKLGINRYTTADLTDARADEILRDGMKVLQDKDSASDVSCPISLVRDGSITTFTTAKGIIASDKDYKDVCALPGRVHIVLSIDYCDGPAKDTIGCADTPGTCMIFVRYTPADEGILWMHEYGHNQGLSHRNNTSAVMNPIILPTCKEVTTAECAKYQVVTLVTRSGRPQPQVKGGRINDIAKFVRQRFIHGVPYEQARAFSPRVVPELLQMLKDTNEQQWWSNIVMTLGMIGDARAVRPLIDHFTSGDSVLPENQYRSKTAVLMSLGYLVNRSHNSEALDFLVKSLSTDIWAARLKWRGTFPDNDTDRAVYLTKLAAWGLAFSGDASAGKALQTFRRSLVRSSSSDASLLEVLNEALTLHSRVKRLGLAAVSRS